jgi:hypothetical protein
MPNCLGVTWVRRQDGRAARYERDAEPKGKNPPLIISCFSWAPEEEPSIETKKLMNVKPNHPDAVAAFANGKREMLIMPWA